MFANVGWYAGQSLYHFHVHIIPSPESVRKDFVEEAKGFLSGDPLNRAIAQRFEKFSERRRIRFWTVAREENARLARALLQR